MPLIRSISGLRGTIGDSLTPETVVRYTAAFARFCGPGTIVVGRDGRPSGGWVESVVVGTLRACGVTARVLGVAPTPTVQLVAEKSDAVGGISITASHNPSEWNGLKFLNSDGIFLDGGECERFFEIVDRNDPAYAPWTGVGEEARSDDSLAAHIDAVLRLPFVDIEALRRRRLKVVVDAVNASGSACVPALLERCGCEVVRLFCDGTGLFPHTPEPLPENLGQLAAAVVAEGADLGIAVDPDADRLVLIDERGMPIGEEYTITQAVRFVLEWERAHHPERELIVVVNLSTTRAVEDVAGAFGATVLRTPVGEINVAARMKEVGAVIGGEGSGGVILSELHYGRDSLAGIIITLQHLVARGLPLSEIRADLPSYEIVKKKTTLGDGVDAGAILRDLEADGAGGRITTGDGLKIDFADSWAHLRLSNTEPIIRVIAEAPTRDQADALATRFMREIESRIA